MKILIKKSRVNCVLELWCTVDQITTKSYRWLSKLSTSRQFNSSRKKPLGTSIQCQCSPVLSAPPINESIKLQLSNSGHHCLLCLLHFKQIVFLFLCEYNFGKTNGHYLLLPLPVEFSTTKGHLCIHNTIEFYRQ